MGIFDIFRKKKVRIETPQPLSASMDFKLVSTKLRPHQDTELKIHEDLAGLIWFGDGPLKNHTKKDIKNSTFSNGGLVFTIRLASDEEPSLIYTKQHLVIPQDISLVERPPYYPIYSELTPEQKGAYISLLQNPYNTNIDIGFVFILYYGLERHLLVGNFEQAYKVILKLRDVHSNKSFQSYSANALVLSSMLHNKGEAALEFIKSLDKSYEYQFSDNLFLLCYFSFDIPITSIDIMRMAKSFDFTNTNYIKKHPDIFQQCLDDLILDRYGDTSILLSNILSENDLSTLPKKDTPVFANTSIRDKNIPTPDMTSNEKLKTELNGLLRECHDIVKNKLSILRKNGLLVAEHKEKKPKTIPAFDVKEEQKLLNELDREFDSLVKRHFIYISIQDFYYKYRALDEKYLSLCIKYCFDDIESLDAMQSQYINNELARAKRIADMLNREFTNKEKAEIISMGFPGKIPAFSRLVIIFEKQKNYRNAIEICDLAIAFKHEANVYTKRKEKLLLRMTG